MSTALSLVLVLGSLCQALAPASSWYLVDVPLAVCEEPYTANTLIPLNIALPGRSDQPHILTVYRTGNKQLSFTVSVLDSKSKDVTSAEVKLDGQSIPSSQVTETATTTTFTATTVTTTAATLPMLNMTLEAALKTEDEEFVRLLRRKPGRALSGKGGGRSYGGGYSGGRRGGYSSYSYTDTRRRATYDDRRRATYDDRRRATYDDRRRAGITDSRRRAPTNQGWVNPSHPRSGYYNYQPSYRSYHRTSYGYSGYHVYPSGSSLGIPLAGLGGLGVGYALGSHFGHYRASRWNTINGGRGFEDCHYQSWKGSCSDCVRRYSMDKCQTSYQLPKAANRDDLMTTAFVPKDFEGPLRLVFSKMEGTEIAKDRICPPDGWHWNASLNTFAGTWTAPDTQDVFIALTPVVLAAPTPPDDPDRPSSSGMSAVPIIILVAFGGGLCCCCAWIFCCDGEDDDNKWRRRSTHRRRGSSHDEFEMQGFRHTAHPYAPPMVGATAVPAMAHATPVVAPGMAAVPAVAMAAAVPAVAVAAAAPVAHAMPVAAPGMAAVPAVAMAAPSSFLEQLSPSGQMWKFLLASAAPALDTAGLLCGPWGDALRAAVLYEMQHPAWSREPRFVETGPVGQVIDFLADRGFEAFVATAQHTEDTLKANPSQLAAPTSPTMMAQALASAPPH